jgi:hypothetical protein
MAYIYKSGLGDAAAYQVSGKPFATGSLTAPASGSTPAKVEFPSVTSWVKVIPVTGSSATHLRVGFSEIGIKNGNYYRLFAGQNANHEAVTPEPLHLKVTELYFLSDDSATVEFDVVAGLTSIDAGSITNNWSGSVGVG